MTLSWHHLLQNFALDFAAALLFSNTAVASLLKKLW